MAQLSLRSAKHNVDASSTTKNRVKLGKISTHPGGKFIVLEDGGDSGSSNGGGGVITRKADAKFENFDITKFQNLQHMFGGARPKISSKISNRNRNILLGEASK